MKICVYCASSATVDKSYFNATERLAREFLKENIEVVFGGGAVGLMGKLADMIIAGGGRIKGIMPKFMNEVEWAHKSFIFSEASRVLADAGRFFICELHPFRHYQGCQANFQRGGRNGRNSSVCTSSLGVH